MEETINKLKFNYIQDIRKKDIDIRDRALILKSYMIDNHLSFRQMAADCGIPLATLAGWIAPAGIDDKTYSKMKRSGMSQADIMNVLKYEKKTEVTKTRTKLELELSNFKAVVRHAINNSSSESASVISEINELQNLLNRLLMHLERRFK